ncbi:Metallo-dependent hydrolase [Multifurca ochricompacta]|uniref:Metallo-dependent hydrolase n=1 Tax=Multifurca ochricompacta TaxID=376703 RepID=A0AAD4M7D1_9AGAM|nr:Metallo-dependent hydrolase [Multifurca ochricompacta]
MFYRGDFVHTEELSNIEIFRDYLLAIDSAGYISHFENASTLLSRSLLSKESEDRIVLIPPGSFLLPTFCDLHLHAPQFLYQGTGLHLPLMEWLNEYAFKAEERLDQDPNLAKRVYTRLGERLVENGTGAVSLFGTIKEETNLILAETMQQIGIRAFVGKLSMDISTRPTYIESTHSESLASVRSFIDRTRALTAHLPDHARLIEPVLTPRFVPTCSDALLQGLGELAQQTGVMVQSHLAEAKDQVKAVRETRGTSDLEVFERAQLLTSRTIQAHCTYLSSEEFSRLARHGTAIAHCPLSNAYFSARQLALREALNRGICVGLGTDIAGGYSVDVMTAMRWAVGVARISDGARLDRIEGDATEPGDKTAVNTRGLGVDWKEALYLGTRGGAVALGLGSGVFKIGVPFDAQQKGTGPLDFFDIGHESVDLSPEMIEKWWCVGDIRNRTGMWIQGRQILFR